MEATLVSSDNWMLSPAFYALFFPDDDNTSVDDLPAAFWKLRGKGQDLSTTFIKCVH